jgi:hypothetical protein
MRTVVAIAVFLNFVAAALNGYGVMFLEWGTTNAFLGGAALSAGAFTLIDLARD